MAQNKPLEELAESSKITFVARVQRLNASNVLTHAATSHTIVVVVERTVHAPAVLGDLTGQQVTVELTTAPGVTVGQRAMFFTNGIVYAEHIVVQEVARLPIAAPAQLEAQVQNVLSAYQQAPSRDLLRRLATADVVVTGKVVAVRKAPQPPGIPISEHDADWHEAVVDVQSVENGLPMKQVVVLFPKSRDIKWRQAPKFSEGQEGVWILHQHQLREVKTPGYTALQPSDFRPKQQRNHVRNLIQRRSEQQ